MDESMAVLRIAAYAPHMLLASFLLSTSGPWFLGAFYKLGICLSGTIMAENKGGLRLVAPSNLRNLRSNDVPVAYFLIESRATDGELGNKADFDLPEHGTN
ncbi:hypothetical protein Trydic_g23691 [Trypoxylus dichotomus]